jgi:hypothetical protein
MTFANASAIRRALENAGVELIEENSGGPGARLKQRLSDQSVPRCKFSKPQMRLSCLRPRLVPVLTLSGE